MSRQRAVMNLVVGTAGALFVLTFGACGSGITPPSSESTAGHGPASSAADIGGAVAGAGGTKRTENSNGGAKTGGVGGGGVTETSEIGGAAGSGGGVAGAGGSKRTASGMGGTGTGGSVICGVLGCTGVGGSGGISSITTVTLRTGTCGDGMIDPGEACDDGNRENGDGCNSVCQIDANWACPTPGWQCVDLRKCGNGVVTSNEACDDGNEKAGDGCSKDCQRIEDGFECRVPGRACTPTCGDGRLVGAETCDDGNDDDGDGCSATCQIEPGADCRDPGKPCRLTLCGNGITEKGETCDCGDGSLPVPAGCPGENGLSTGDGRGCSKTCSKEPRCTGGAGVPRVCDAVCGDGNRESNEECDDGNQFDGDGCSKDCKREKGFTCADKIVPDAWPCRDSVNGKDCPQHPVTTANRSECSPRCGDGILAGNEQCDCGDLSVPLAAGCLSRNDDRVYGGCMTNCKPGPYCGDGIVNGTEACDRGKDNGSPGPDGCTLACTRPHFCGDGILDTDRGEECDLGALNGQKVDDNGQRSDAPNARVMCPKECYFLIH